MDRLSKIENTLKHEQQFKKELELRSDQPKIVQENILPDCLTVDRSREGLSAGDAVDHPVEKKDTQSYPSQSDTTQEYVLLTQLVRSGLPMLKTRKLIEICTYTMNMSKAAQQSKTGSWIALTPISIETGFDLLTCMGRLKAENYLRRENLISLLENGCVGLSVSSRTSIWRRAQNGWQEYSS